MLFAGPFLTPETYPEPGELVRACSVLLFGESGRRLPPPNFARNTQVRSGGNPFLLVVAVIYTMNSAIGGPPKHPKPCPIKAIKWFGSHVVSLW